MNSKQLNFYSHPDEMENHLKFIFLNGSSISYEPFLEERYVIYDDVDSAKFETNIYKIIIFRRDEASANILTNFISAPNYYLFEPLESDVIFFSFPKIIDKSKLFRGRFYFVKGYWKDGQWIEKNKDFIFWATKLLDNFKRTFLMFKDPISKENCTTLVKQLIDENRIELRPL